MPVDQDYVDALIADPRERLDVEIKDWIDPRSAHGQAKIVRACLAMRNQDGGFLLVGFENGTWRPNTAGAPADVRAEWDADEVQGLVSGFASELFEVHVRFGERDGQAFPALEVEPGVRSPVASKRDLFDSQDPSRKLVKEHAVYVRSLSSSGRAATSEVRHGDWPELTRRCLDNRESDIGRFARRQLGGIDPEAARVLAEVLAETLTGTSEGQSGAGALGRSTLALAITELHEGFDRLQRERVDRSLDRIPRHGAPEVAAAADGPGTSEDPPTEEFLNRLNAANPGYTGWPLWLDTRGHGDDEPYTLDGGWEALIYDYEPDSWYNHLDFWRADPAGRFYAYRGFEDDVSEGRGVPGSDDYPGFRHGDLAGRRSHRRTDGVRARHGVSPGGDDHGLCLPLVGPPRTPPLLVDEPGQASPRTPGEPSGRGAAAARGGPPRHPDLGAWFVRARGHLRVVRRLRRLRARPRRHRGAGRRVAGPRPARELIPERAALGDDLTARDRIPHKYHVSAGFRHPFSSKTEPDIYRVFVGPDSYPFSDTPETYQIDPDDSFTVLRKLQNRSETGRVCEHRR